MNLKIGYWNLNKKERDFIAPYILELLRENDLDLLVLSEFNFSEKDLNSSFLPKQYIAMQHSPVCKKVMIIKKKELDFSVNSEDRRFMVISSKKYSLTIVGLHLPDNFSDAKAQYKRTDTLRNVLESSIRIRNRKNIFIGDYNCMPYSDELTDVNVMHCVLFKKEMKSKCNSKEKHYNPMLLILNEEDEVYGSYRYDSGSCPLYWYAYDQAIVSKDLVDSILDIKYLKQISGNYVLHNRKQIISDHLPLFLKINV